MVTRDDVVAQQRAAAWSEDTREHIDGPMSARCQIEDAYLYAEARRLYDEWVQS